MLVGAESSYIGTGELGVAAAAAGGRNDPREERERVGGDSH